MYKIPSSKLLQRDLGFNNELPLTLQNLPRVSKNPFTKWAKLTKPSKALWHHITKNFNASSNAFPWPIAMVYITQKSITYLQIEWDLQIFDPKVNGIKIHLKMNKIWANLHKYPFLFKRNKQIPNIKYIWFKNHIKIWIRLDFGSKMERTLFRG